MTASIIRGNLLLCEDDQSMRAFWSMYFNGEGWNVMACVSPEEAFEILSNECIEIHLGYFDVQYVGSEYCGFDIGRRVSLSENSFPFYIMSMTHTIHKEKEAEQVGAMGFVEKNYDAMFSSYCRAMGSITPNKESRMLRDPAYLSH